MVKEEGFPLDLLIGVVYFIWISLSIRGHLPSHHHCQTLYRRQTDALFLPFAKKWVSLMYNSNSKEQTLVTIQGDDDNMKDR